MLQGGRGGPAAEVERRANLQQRGPAGTRWQSPHEPAVSSTHKSPSCTNCSAATGSEGATNTRLVFARSCTRDREAGAAGAVSRRRRRRHSGGGVPAAAMADESGRQVALPLLIALHRCRSAPKPAQGPQETATPRSRHDARLRGAVGNYQLSRHDCGSHWANCRVLCPERRVDCRRSWVHQRSCCSFQTERSSCGMQDVQNGCC